jgi:Mg2+-importing ATPase
MIVFGLLSSVFDILTLRLGFHASAALSRSGWFIESTITELAIMLVLRTNRPLLPKPPRPCCHPSPSPPSQSPCPTARWPDHSASPAVPAWILAALAGLTAFYVIANEGPNLASH